MTKIKHKANLISIILLIVGIICLVLEKTFYGQQMSVADSSLLLPIGMISVIAGLFLSLFLSFRMVLDSIFNRQPKRRK